jgi:A nuclease family of the HNH/ENDO VII superfamily with conserved AHH
MGTEKDHARGTRQESWKASAAFNRQSNLAVKSTPDESLAWSGMPKENWLTERQRNPEEQSKTFRPISVKVGSLDAMEAYVFAMRGPAPIDEANLKSKKPEKSKEATGEKSKASPVLVASANLTPGQISTEEQKGAQSPQLLAQASAPARVPTRGQNQSQRGLQDPLVRTPIDLKTGAPAGQPNSGPALNRTPVGSDDNTPMDPSTLVEGMKRGEAFRANIQERFGDSLPSGVDGVPVYFLDMVQTRWGEIGPSMLVRPGDPAPKLAPPNPQQMVLVWQGAWQQLPEQLKTPELTKVFMSTFRELIARANKANKQQPKKSASTAPPPGAAAGAAAARAIAGARTPAPAPQTGPDVQQILGNVQQSRITHNAEAGDLMATQEANTKARKARQKADAKTSEETREATSAQQRKAQDLRAQESEANNAEKLAEIQQRKSNIYRNHFNGQRSRVPSAQRQQVDQQTQQIYQQYTGRAYNFKDPNDPRNDPKLLSELQDQTITQLGIVTLPIDQSPDTRENNAPEPETKPKTKVPSVTKPEPLPQKSGNGPDKKIPTLPLQTKRDTTKQGGFVPQPLPEVRPTTEGEQPKEDQAQSVTSKATEPSEAEPGKQEQTKGKGQKKRTKPTASSVKKAMAATRKWGTDYRKNYKEAYGSIPEGSQIHHLTPRAVYNENPLSQEWTRRGITGLNDPENLEALPQTKEAYDKSDIKIQHSGSHKNWNEHVTEVLEEEQTRLKGQYGSLDKVPDDVMKQTKDKVMQNLREDLFDKDLGIEKGWIQNTDNGMDKLSQAQPSAQLG